MLKRHYLLEISEEGRRVALQKVLENFHYCDINAVEHLILRGYNSGKIPGIARREEKNKPDGTVAVGFSSPDLFAGQRLRVPSFVPEDSITGIVNPYDVLQKDFKPRTKCLRALQEALEAAVSKNINLGIWGSGALEVYTSLPYTRENSDLDLLIKGGDLQTIESFYRMLKEIGAYYRTIIDLELDLPDGYGIKAAELFMETEQVLAKSIFTVKLFAKELVMSQING